MSKIDDIKNIINPSNIKSWKQVIVAIAITSFNAVYIKQETAIYSTIIIVSFIAFLFYLVKKSTSNKYTNIATKLSGNLEGLNVLMKDIKTKKQSTQDTVECKCFDKLILEITSRIRLYRTIINGK